MESGIIIIFSSNDTIINVDDFAKVIGKYQSKVCLVNNSNSEEINKIINNIILKVSSNTDVFLLNNRKKKMVIYAVKVGARFLLNKTDFDFIVFLEANDIESLKFLKYHLLDLSSKKEKYKSLPTRSDRNVLKNVFSLIDVLKIKEPV